MAKKGNNYLDSAGHRSNTEITPQPSHGQYPYDRGRHLLAATTLWAYGDESGINDSGEWVILAGYIGSPKVWAKFRRRWAKTLRKYGVHEFHAIDFFPNARREHCDEYRGWSEKKASKFLAELLVHVDDHFIRPLGVAVNAADWKALSDGERGYLSGGILRWNARMEPDGTGHLRVRFKTDGAPTRPYMAALHGFIHEVLLATPEDALAHIVLDRHTTYQAGALQIFDEQFRSGRDFGRDAELEKRLGDLTYSESVREEALQVADLYVYLWNRTLRDGINTDLLKQAVTSIRRRPGKIREMDRRYFDDVLHEVSVKVQERLTDMGVEVDS